LSQTAPDDIIDIWKGPGRSDANLRDDFQSAGEEKLCKIFRCLSICRLFSPVFTRILLKMDKSWLNISKLASCGLFNHVKLKNKSEKFKWHRSISAFKNFFDYQFGVVGCVLACYVRSRGSIPAQFKHLCAWSDDDSDNGCCFYWVMMFLGIRWYSKHSMDFPRGCRVYRVIERETQAVPRTSDMYLQKKCKYLLFCFQCTSC
jgi:hypothetical protein